MLPPTTWFRINAPTVVGLVANVVGPQDTLSHCFCDDIFRIWTLWDVLKQRNGGARTGLKKIDKLLILLSYLLTIRFCSPKSAPREFAANEVDTVTLKISLCLIATKSFLTLNIVLTRPARKNALSSLSKLTSIDRLSFNPAYKATTGRKP